jgi:hypothetical protein
LPSYPVTAKNVEQHKSVSDADFSSFIQGLAVQMQGIGGDSVIRGL